MPRPPPARKLVPRDAKVVDRKAVVLPSWQWVVAFLLAVGVLVFCLSGAFFESRSP